MRGLRVFVGVLFVLSAALVACDSTPKEPTPDPAVAAALAPACSGTSVSGAGAVNTSGAVANHLEEQTVTLAANATVDVTLDVACAEMHQDQPTGDDTFHVLNEPPQADLVRLLQAPEFGDETGRVQQFAVWTITNNPRRNYYVGLTSGFDIFGTGPDDEEIAAIRDLFDAAAIDTDKYRALK
jgi:hypothetical protein